jgi:hypothetical protein
MNFNPEWILNPIATYSVMATGLGALLFLWVGARLDANKFRHEITGIKDQTNAALRELGLKVNAIATSPAPDPQAPSQEHSAINLTRRTRALHMRYRGEDPHTIAAALGVSMAEIDLLLKLDKMLQNE